MLFWSFNGSLLRYDISLYALLNAILTKLVTFDVFFGVKSYEVVTFELSGATLLILGDKFLLIVLSSVSSLLLLLSLSVVS